MASRAEEGVVDYAKIAPMMGQLWAPIAAVTSSWNGKDNGQIAVAIGGASIVADRPRVAVQLYKTNFTHEMVMGSGAFALCFMRQDQLDLVHRLGYVSGRDRDKLADVPYRRRATGSPVLDHCFGYLDCRVVNAMDGGDMTVFLADRIMVMYRGQIVEIGKSEDVYRTPKHPFTENFLKTVLHTSADADWHTAALRAEDLEDPNLARVTTSADKHPGCIYSSACTERFERCQSVAPKLRALDEHHYVACHLYDPKIRPKRAFAER